MLNDPALIRKILINIAQAGESVSYSGLLNQIGLRFTRPKMRALCKTLDAVDAEAAGRDEPTLAVLVVREADGLPGQGWWTGGRALLLRHEGDWTGPEARALVRRLQEEAFDYWRER